MLIHCVLRLLELKLVGVSWSQTRWTVAAAASAVQMMSLALEDLLAAAVTVPLPTKVHHGC